MAVAVLCVFVNSFGCALAVLCLCFVCGIIVGCGLCVCARA